MRVKVAESARRFALTAEMLNFVCLRPLENPTVCRKSYPDILGFTLHFLNLQVFHDLCGILGNAIVNQPLTVVGKVDVYMRPIPAVDPVMLKRKLRATFHSLNLRVMKHLQQILTLLYFWPMNRCKYL